MLSEIALGLALLPLVLVLVNLVVYRRPRQLPPHPVSILIPARNESANIGRALEAALATRGVAFEVVVLDDGSEDDTAAIVESFMTRDSRVRLVSSAPLPAGWIGKEHACHQLAQHATNPVLFFQDADVVLHPDAAARLSGELIASNLGLLSGIPWQETRTFGEKLLIPLIDYVLLGYLPLLASRLLQPVSMAAGCGQLMVANAERYAAVGGHGAIHDRIHDGLALPRLFREAGFKTDIVFLGKLARCRMYERFSDVWSGFAKNAHEAMASPGAILPWTVLLGGGHILPWVALVAEGTALSIAAVLASLGSRFLVTARSGQSLLSAVLHPLGILLTIAIQWYALIRRVLGRPIAWKGRLPT